MEQAVSFRLIRRYLARLSFYHEAIGGAVAVGILQHITDMVVALFVNTKEARTLGMGSQPQTATLRHKRFHEPTAMLAPLFVVCPSVDGPVLIEREAVHHATEHLRAVYIKREVFHAVDVGGLIHIVVRPDAQADFTPSRDGRSQLVDAFPSGQAHHPLGCSLLHHSLAGLRVEHHGGGAGRTGIPYLFLVEHQRVYRFIGSRLAYLHVEVRTARAARVATDGYHLSPLYPEQGIAQEQVHVKPFLGILLRLHILGYGRSKRLQVSVDGGESVRMGHIESLSVAGR